MRVLIAYGDSHRSYGETLEAALRGTRPGVEVSLVRAEELGVGVARLDPHLVVSDRPSGADPGGNAAWVRLSTDPDEPSEFCVGGRRRPLTNPGLGELLALVDAVEELLRGGQEPGGC
jgi:hypothetical protein